MAQNYLLGEKGIQINAFMAATAWNLKKMMQKLKRRIFVHYFRILFQQNFILIIARKRLYKERLTNKSESSSNYCEP